MQEKSDSFDSFSDRFQALSVRKGWSTAEACREVGISRSLFYEIRDGKREPTLKAWAKLAQAEQAAGISGTGRLPGMVAPEAQEPFEDRIQARIDEVIRELEALKKEIAESRN